MNNTINLQKQTFYTNKNYKFKNHKLNMLNNKQPTKQTVYFGSTNPNAIYNSILQGTRYENLSLKQQTIVKTYLNLKDKLGLNILPKLEFRKPDARAAEYSWSQGVLTISPEVSLEGELGSTEEKNLPVYVKNVLKNPKANSVEGILVHELNHFKQNILMVKKLGLKSYFNLIINGNEKQTYEIDNSKFNKEFYENLFNNTPNLLESESQQAEKYIKSYKERIAAGKKEENFINQISLYINEFMPYYNHFEGCLDNLDRKGINDIGQSLAVSTEEKRKIIKCANLLLDAQQQHNIKEFDNILEEDAYKSQLNYFSKNE